MAFTAIISASKKSTIATNPVNFLAKQIKGYSHQVHWQFLTLSQYWVGHFWPLSS